MPIPKRVLVVVWIAAVILGGASSATPADTTNVAPSEPLTVVLLPTRAHVVEVGIKLRPSKEWTAEAGATIDAAVRELIGQSTMLRGVELPSITPDERAALDEVLAVATLLQLQGYGTGTKRITQTLRAHFDRSLGRSLSFLQDRTGVDYALVSLGTQAEQSKELVALSATGAVASVLFPPLLVLPSSSVSYAGLFLIELRTGEVRWLNGRTGREIGGYNFTDFRDPESAHKVVEELLQPYPEIPSKFKEKAVSIEARTGLVGEVVSPPTGQFALQTPVGWRVETDPRKSIVIATRDGRLLNEFKVEMRRHGHAFPETEQKSTRDSSPDQLSQWYEAEFRAHEFEELKIAEVSFDEQLAGRAAFRMRFSYRLPSVLGGARIERVTIGAATQGGLLIAELSAPQLDFFAQALPQFEESTRTIELVPRKSPR